MENIWPVYDMFVRVDSHRNLAILVRNYCSRLEHLSRKGISSKSHVMTAMNKYKKFNVMVSAINFDACDTHGQGMNNISRRVS